jgi:hypothetical protein
LLAAGLLVPARWAFGNSFKQAGWAPAVIVVGLIASRLSWVSGRHNVEREQFGEVVQYVNAHRQPGDAVYVYYGAGMAFRVYADDGLRDVAVVERWARQLPPDEQRARMWRVMGNQPRAWLLTTHLYPGEGEVLLDTLNAACQPLDVVRPAGAAGYLFDCHE